MLANSNQNLRNMPTHSQTSTTMQFSETGIQASNLTPIKQMVTVLPITNTGAYHYSTPSRQASTEQPAEHPTNPIQVKNYINWVNTHLKKRPGVKLIENLQTDMRDGVALIHLIEVISGHVLADVNLNPKSLADYKDNIEKILRFMQQNSIKMHQTTTKDIVEGALKPTMRLILSLAAHFKPTNVQHYTAAQAHASGTTESLGKLHGSSNSPYMSGSKSAYRLSSKDENGPAGSANVSGQSGNENGASSQKRIYNRTHDSMTHLVQAACVNLADARRYNNQQSQNFNVKYVKRNNLSNTSSPSEPRHTSSNQTYPVIKLEHASPVAHSDANKIEEVKSPGASNAHPLASSTIISTSSSTSPATGTPTANATALPIKHANIRIEVKQETSNAAEDSCQQSKDSSKSNGNVTVKAEPTICESNPAESLAKNHNLLTNELFNMFGNLDEDISHDIKGLKSDLLKLQSLLMTCSNQELTKILNLDGESGSERSDGRADSLDSGRENSSASSKECCSSNLEQNSSSDGEIVSGLTPAEQIAILKSRIQQLEILAADLRNELNHTKSESMHSAGIHSGLKSRVNEQDNTILEMKKEQLNLHLVNQQLEKEKEELLRKLDDRSLVINRLKHELGSKNEQLDKMRTDIVGLTREKEEQAKFVKQQDRVVKTVTSVIEKVQEKESVLVERLENTNRKLGAVIETCHKDANGKSNNQMLRQHQVQMLPSSAAIISIDEANFMRESLIKLRQNIHSSHPSQLIINTLEQGFATILERSNQLNSASSSYASSSSSCTSSSANSPVMSIMPALNTIQLGGNHSAPSSASSTSSSAYSSSSLITVQRQPAIQSQVGMLLNSNNAYRGEEDTFKHQSESPLDKHAQADHSNESFVPSEGNVKKIISRFFSNSGTNPSPTAQAVFSTSLPPPVSAKQRSEPQKQPSNSLLTISSSNSSAASPSPPSMSSYSSASVATATTSTSLKTSSSSAPSQAKVIYYLDKNSTPFMTTLSKPLNAISLKELKELLKLKNPNLRFHFKSHDPEFGIVREEITNENAILPSFEGRIVAWICENEPTECK